MVLSRIELFSISRWSEKISDPQAAEDRLLVCLSSELPGCVIDECRVPLREARMPGVHEDFIDFLRLYQRVRLATGETL